jgi:hypothetical protein
LNAAVFVCCCSNDHEAPEGICKGGELFQGVVLVWDFKLEFQADVLDRAVGEQFLQIGSAELRKRFRVKRHASFVLHKIVPELCPNETETTEKSLAEANGSER